MRLGQTAQRGHAKRQRRGPDQPFGGRNLRDDRPFPANIWGGRQKRAGCAWRGREMGMVVVGVAWRCVWVVRGLYLGLGEVVELVLRYLPC